MWIDLKWEWHVAVHLIYNGNEIVDGSKVRILNGAKQDMISKVGM